MRSNILDLNNITRAVDETTGQESITFVRGDLKVNYWFYKDSIALQYAILGKHKVALHMFGHSEMSLETLRNWIIESSLWVVDNSEITCIMVFCKRSDLRLRFLLANCGATRQCVLEEANGIEDELLYVFNVKHRDKYERRVTCPQ